MDVDCRFLTDYRHTLHEGEFSTIYSGRDIAKVDEVAVKVFKKTASKQEVTLAVSIYSAMRTLQHRNIAKVLAIENQENELHPVIFMELAENGSLANMLEKPEHYRGLLDDEFRPLLEQVACSLKYLQDQRIILKDIKPGNILIFWDENARFLYKLTNIQVPEEKLEKLHMCLPASEEYMPEDDSQETGQEHGHVLRQSLGLLFYQCSTGQLPFTLSAELGNQQQMYPYPIIRDEESSPISGRQCSVSEDMDWSRQLPPMCNMSDELKVMMAPVLAALLETDQTKVWTLDQFFQQVEGISDMVKHHVFCPQTGSRLTVYIDKDGLVSQLKEQIAKQTKIEVSNQFFLLDGSPLEDDTILSRSTNDHDLVICCNTDSNFGGFPVPIEWGPNCTTEGLREDDMLARECLGIVCFLLQKVEQCAVNQGLMKRAAVCLHRYIETECNKIFPSSIIKQYKGLLHWGEETFLQHEKITHLHQILQGQGIQLEAGEVYKATDTAEMEYVQNVSKQLFRKLEDFVMLVRVCTADRCLNESFGCPENNDCVEKLKLYVDTIKKIEDKFRQDIIDSDLCERSHLFDKNILENTYQLAMKVYRDCLKVAESQHMSFLGWYRRAVDSKEEIISKATELNKFADMFREKLTGMSVGKQ